MVSNARSTTVAQQLALIVISIVGCASLPASRYGVDEVEFDGVEQMSETELRNAIATAERDVFLFWVWPWTDWELFDNTVFERDVARIERWYKARGYYHAKVTGAEVEPRAAVQSDRIPLPKELGEDEEPPCERLNEDEGCLVSVRFAVDEGEPVLVESVLFEGIDGLSEHVQEELRDAVVLVPRERFDERLYDESKRQVKRALGTASYARARVDGSVVVDPATHLAKVKFAIKPGPTCTFGEITVAGNEVLSAEIIESASYLEPGQPYDTEALEEANRAIASLGAFSSVQVEPQMPAEDDDSSVIDVVIKVTPGRLFHLGIGIGVQNGVLDFGDQQGSNNRWDTHLIFFVEDRDFLGGFRKLRIEDRPQLIFCPAFPSFSSPRPGNVLNAEFRQPDFLEARTTLVTGAQWDYGPDPNLPGDNFNCDQNFFRHEFTGHIGPERSFFDGRLFVRLALRATLFLPDEGSNSPSSYHSMFFEEHVGIDLRDSPTMPRKGIYVGANFDQSALLPSSWTFNRISPDVRGYLPIGDSLVLAGRFAIGWMDVSAKDDAVDDLSPFDEKLGPRVLRFRSGGANSNRGYPANTVGASRHAGNGGLREWEASMELRLRLNQDWGLVGFVDMSDVDDGCREDCAVTSMRSLAELTPRFNDTSSDNDPLRYRWDHLHMSVGVGVRLATPIGPFRLDVGYQVPGLQWPDDSPEAALGRVKSPLLLGLIGPDLPMAWHFSFGESF